MPRYITQLGTHPDHFQQLPHGPWMRIARALILLYGLSGSIRHLRYEQHHRVIYHRSSSRVEGFYTDQELADLITLIRNVWMLTLLTDRVVPRLWVGFWT